jgi:predicted MFS family arabinose efflux permease
LGLLIATAGLGLDITWHQLISSTHEEGAISLSNPGHITIGIGGALALGGTVFGLSSTNRLLAIAAAILIPAFAIGFASWEELDPPHEEAFTSEDFPPTPPARAPE